jgi:hypothetical protein
MVNVTLTLKIMIYPLDEISGGISAGSPDFPSFSEASHKRILFY